MDSDKIYVIRNKIYTEEQLIHIINFYEKYHYNSLLPDELMYKILLESSVENLPNLCLINNKYKKICKSSNFWKLKFENDGLPFIIDVKHKKLRDIIAEYNKVKGAFDISNKLVDYILNKKIGYFGRFLINEEEHDVDWSRSLPKDLVDIIMKLEIHYDRSIIFNIKKLSINLSYTIDPNTSDESYETFDVELNRSEFVEYLTKLFYYNPNFIIENYDSDDRDIYIEYKFMNDSTYVRKQLPEWI